MSLQRIPGPWTYNNNGSVVDEDGFKVAEIQEQAILLGWADLGIQHWSDAPGTAYIERDEAEVEAWGTMLAAAPDLYDIAELIVIILDQGGTLDHESTFGGKNICEKLRAAVTKARGGDPV